MARLICHGTNLFEKYCSTLCFKSRCRLLRGRLLANSQHLYCLPLSNCLPVGATLASAGSAGSEVLTEDSVSIRLNSGSPSLISRLPPHPGSRSKFNCNYCFLLFGVSHNWPWVLFYLRKVVQFHQCSFCLLTTPVENWFYANNIISDNKPFRNFSWLALKKMV